MFWDICVNKRSRFTYFRELPVTEDLHCHFLSTEVSSDQKMTEQSPSSGKGRMVVPRSIKTGKIWGFYPLIQGLELTGSEESNECCCDAVPFYMNTYL